MLLNEHQSKQLFAEAGIAIPTGECVTPESISGFEPSFPAPWFCKAQVLTGGRGKAGAIRRVENEEELLSQCRELFAMRVKGHAVPLVRVEPATAFSHEFYCSFTVARERESLVFTVGAGGVEVEAQSRDVICIQDIGAMEGLQPRHVRTAFFHLAELAGLTKEHWPGFLRLVQALYGAVREYGLLLAEINPLVLTTEGGWTALDGKAEIDDTVLAFKPDLERFYQPEHATAEENVAREAGLSFVDLEGWVGLMGNGAGLAMATMDLLNQSGLPAANFMDLGGAADEQRMARALDLLFTNPKVEAVFINLFGGIVSSEAVAKAVAAALKNYPDGAPPKPLVARLAGNGGPEGRALLEGLGAPGLYVAEAMTDAVETLRGLAPRETPPMVVESPSAATRATTEAPEALVPPRHPLLTLGPDSRVVVQGITGRAAGLHAKRMMDYGVNVVAGVTPFKGGGETLGVPVYNSMRKAVAEHEPEATIIFVPGPAAADAILEAADGGVPVAVCITEGVPQAHMLAVKEALARSRTLLIGPNTPGVIIPGAFKLGIMPEMAYTPGPVAVFSRSGTLTYETSARLSAAGCGQSICVGMGGDPFVGAGFAELIETVRHDANTRAVLVLGEIGGSKEEELAEYVVRTGFDKPLFAFIAGRTAPPGKRLGHAGAILDERSGTVESKLETLAAAGFTLCPDMSAIPELISRVL